MSVGCASIADTRPSRLSTRAAQARAAGPDHGQTVRRRAAAALCGLLAMLALWSTGAHAQVTFRETFGAANGALPTAQSTADGNWTSAACLNGQIVNAGGDATSDGGASTHYLYHNTANCAYTAGQAVWRNVAAITVQPNKSYMFSYWTMVTNQVSDPVLSQVVTPNAGAVTVLTTLNTAYPATNNTWVRRWVIFTTSATTTSVNLRINNASTAATGNDFGIDDVILAPMPTVSLTKTTLNGAGGAFGFALTNTQQTTGTVTTSAANTPTAVDGNASAAVTDFTVAAIATAITINETSLPATWSFGSASCTNSAGATVGTLSGRQITIPAASVALGESFACSYVNQTQPSFGTCSSTMYLGVGGPTQLHRIDTSTNPLTYPPIGAPDALGYNAMGYDPASNYLFATRFDSATSTYRLLRIGGDGSVLDMGAIAGAGINAVTTIASGEIGADGFYYLKQNATTNQMWRVNLNTRVATLITMSQAINSADLAWSNGLLYVHDHTTGFFHSINPTTGAVLQIGPSGLIGDVNAFGSMIGASNGIFGRRNNGGFYQFDTATGLATLISDAPAGAGDGAKCATTAVQFAADLAITKTDGSAIYTPGNNVTYSIVVSNNGPFGVQNAQVTDPLPTGVTTANWTCGSATGGAVCGAASGTGAINTTANLPAGGSVTYSLTLFVPSTFSGNLVNTATVTTPTGTVDATPANNSATDTDTQFPLPPGNVATITCNSGGALFNTAYDGAGGRLTSGADNYWQVALTTTPVTGAPPAGLSYAAAQVVAAPPANYIVSPYGNANWISHAANAIHPSNVNYDVFYRFQFNLGPGVDPAAMSLDMQFYADNAVYEVWVNGAAQGVQSNYGAANPYFYAGFAVGAQASGVLNGPWQGGLNEIVVHIKSGPGAQAFLAQVLPPAAVCAPATVTLNKTTRFVTGGPFNFALSNTAQATGTVTTPAADAPAQVDGDTASPATIEPYAVAVFGTDVVITESALPSGWTLSDASCTSGGTPIGSRSGGAYTIPGSAIDASAESFVCNFTNTPGVDLRIDKAANPATLRSGETVTYTLTVNNDGPGPGDGAVLSDPAIPGVDCSAGSLSCGSASGGAVCPGAPTVAALQGSGVTLPTLPAGGSMQFTLVCTVTASGL
ncbi:DUF11 domain-containing protein [Lysobacter sp. CCNWLW3]|uniref:DUF11 domain-containing protein n=1 Tax=unclassified Lysobacter TaxID=2635362 RepID=UPI002FD5C6EB